VIREDRELLAELAKLNQEMAPLAMRMMDDSASAAEQAHYAQRLIAAGARLQRRANGIGAVVIDGEVFDHESLSIPELTVEPRREP
jgi:hypothetical protein